MKNATVSKLEFLKDEKGNFIYDEVKIEAFKKKAVKTMEKQNALILSNPVKYKSYSVCDAKQFAELQLEIYKHTFRLTKSIAI